MISAFLKIIRCRCCSQIFHVCQSCWRGQAYCCDGCRLAAQRMIHRRAQKKYRQTEKGKEAHREWERMRRMRNYKKTVDDAGSTPDIDHDKLPVNSPFTTGCCHFCGKTGMIVDHFPRRGYGGRYVVVNAASLYLHGG